MKRSRFIKNSVLGGLFISSMKLKALNKLMDGPSTDTMPALFLGHGSPMNAIEENEFVQGFRRIGSEVPKPKAILCISAHWETRGTFVTAMEHPRTIHDFGGFPPELYQQQYPAPGSPELAQKTVDTVESADVGLDQQWGLDHGAWTVIRHMYPEADIPVVQMSLDRNKAARFHYDLARELKQLRNQGILIIGSGNMVHNLGMVAWNKMQEDDYAYDWAREANENMKDFILHDEHDKLIDYTSRGKAFLLAIPSPEHYLPLLYALALKGKDEGIQLFNDKAVAGSLSMTSVLIS